MTKLHFIDLDPTLAKGLCEMLPNVNFELDDNGTPVRATEGDTLSVKSDENGISITYPSRACFYRALSFLGDDGEISVCESKKYADMLCYMADMSRKKRKTR